MLTGLQRPLARLYANGILKRSVQLSKVFLCRKSDIAFVLDIDGVLIRGSKKLPTAKPALELMNKHKIPFILLTNGGGWTEKSRVESLSKEIGVPLSPLQLVQSHTPMKAFAVNKTFRRVLVCGGDKDNVRYAAQEYGFEDIVLPVDLVKACPTISPHHRFTKSDLEKYGKDVNMDKPFDAVLVFNDPRDMTTDLQVILDLLVSKDGVLGTKRRFVASKDRQEPSVPIVFSNNDFLWASEYELPRYGQGAFRIIVEAIYNRTNELKQGQNLISSIMGKPFKVQYDFAHHVLIDWRSKLLLNKTHETTQLLPPLNEEPKNSPFDKIYMIGDNPASDIKGANDNGWESMLLRTGVFKDEDWGNIVARPTCGVHDNVLDAVEYAMKKHDIL